jgi:hypothetical protein
MAIPIGTDPYFRRSRSPAFGMLGIGERLLIFVNFHFFDNLNLV